MYSKRLLSIQTDRLPALAGLAEDYAIKTGTTRYIAGSWLEQFLCQLLWFRPRQRTRSLPTDEYLGPTWSWCSIGQAPVAYEELGIGSPQDWTAELVEVEAALLSPLVPFGRVIAARLVLSAWVKEVVWSELSIHERGLQLSNTDRPVIIRLDERRTLSECAKLLFIEIYRSTTHPSCLNGLILDKIWDEGNRAFYEGLAGSRAHIGGLTAASNGERWKSGETYMNSSTSFRTESPAVPKGKSERSAPS